MNSKPSLRSLYLSGGTVAGGIGITILTLLTAIWAFGSSTISGNQAKPLFVEQQDYTCPAFCRNDIVEFEHRDMSLDKMSVGDFIVVDYDGAPPWVSRILVESKHTRISCPDDDYNWIEPTKPEELCTRGNACDAYDFLILGGPDPDFNLSDGQAWTLITDISVQDVRPRKIGDLHDYYLLTDGITEIVGNSLLNFYRLTGINLFGQPWKNHCQFLFLSPCDRSDFGLFRARESQNYSGENHHIRQYILFLHKNSCNLC
jgi:hypothetical protein